jgi:hypothetical protein
MIEQVLNRGARHGGSVFVGKTPAPALHPSFGNEGLAVRRDREPTAGEKGIVVHAFARVGKSGTHDLAGEPSPVPRIGAVLRLGDVHQPILESASAAFCPPMP